MAVRLQNPIDSPLILNDPYMVKRPRGRHKGIDIKMPDRTPIRPIAEGTVIHIGYDAKGFGHWIVIQHSQGLTSLYAHLAEKPTVSVGQKVGLRDGIGLSGNTGHSSGPHLHLETFIMPKGKTLFGNVKFSDGDRYRQNPVFFLPGPLFDKSGHQVWGTNAGSGFGRTELATAVATVLLIIGVLVFFTNPVAGMVIGAGAIASAGVVSLLPDSILNDGPKVETGKNAIEIDVQGILARRAAEEKLKKAIDDSIAEEAAWSRSNDDWQKEQERRSREHFEWMEEERKRREAADEQRRQDEMRRAEMDEAERQRIDAEWRAEDARRAAEDARRREEEQRWQEEADRRREEERRMEDDRRQREEQQRQLEAAQAQRYEEDRQMREADERSREQAREQIIINGSGGDGTTIIMDYENDVFEIR